MLKTYLEKLKQDHARVAEYDEARTKQAIILPILQKLGWDIFNMDEVTPEYSVESRKVDFALRLIKGLKFFLKLKRQPKVWKNIKSNF